MNNVHKTIYTIKEKASLWYTYCSEPRILIKFTSVKFLPNTAYFSCKVCHSGALLQVLGPRMELSDEIEQ
jgi:hypothetical protein